MWQPWKQVAYARLACHIAHAASKLEAAGGASRDTYSVHRQSVDYYGVVGVVRNGFDGVEGCMGVYEVIVERGTSHWTHNT